MSSTEPTEPTGPTEEPLRRRTKRRRNLTTQQRAAVGVIVAAAAVAGALAGTHPTGTAVVDQLLPAAMAALTALAGARARRWTLATGAALTTLAMAGWLAVVPAAALVTVVVLFRLDRREPVVGAAVAAVVANAALRLGWDPFVGASALVAAAAVLPILASGWRHARKRAKRVVGVAVGVGAAVAAVVIVLFTVALLSVRSDAQAAIDAARAGLVSARDADTAAATAQFDRAAEGFARADERVGAWWALPARAVPVLAQNARVLQDVAGQGAQLASASAAAGRSADVQTLQVRAGALDPGRIAAMEPALVSVAGSLDDTLGVLDGIDSPWVAGPVRDRLDRLETEVVDALPEAELAIDAVRVAPGLLGGEGPRRYFVAVVTPAESRGLGGYMGSFAELTAVDGQLDLARDGSTSDLGQASANRDLTVTGPPDWLERYGSLSRSVIWSNLTLPPDLPTVSAVTAQLYPQTDGGSPIDGMITVDPAGLAALLRLTGPVSVPGIPQPLTPDNVEQFLLVDQYQLFADDQAQEDALGEVARAVFDRLTTGDLPGPRALGEALGPAVRNGHLQIATFDAEENGFFDRWGATGAMAPVDGDFVELVTNNAGNSKIDVFLHRRLDYTATVDPSGQVRAAAIATLRNDAPTSGLPDEVIGNNRDLPNGTMLVGFNLYTPLPLQFATVNGQFTPFATQVELGRYVHWAFLEVPPGQSVEVRLDLVGAVALPDGRYALEVGRQPVVHPDEVAVTVFPGTGSELIRPRDLDLDPATGAASTSFTLEHPQRVSVGTRPA
ncbi:MAG: DUF4012 domain-containing protein [Acidimicrobiales bacterium]|nr:DUF4012 domain-containing protein [Acidimicrobiales bacterium]